MPTPQRPAARLPAPPAPPVAGQAPRLPSRPVTKPISRPEPPRSVPAFAEDAKDLQSPSAVVAIPVAPVPVPVSAAKRPAIPPPGDHRVRRLTILAASLGLALLVVLGLWLMALSAARHNATLVVSTADEAMAKRGELERLTYEAQLARIGNASLVLAYAVDQLDASRVAGALKGGGIGALREAATALGAVAHAQSGLTGKILVDLRAAHARMQAQKLSPNLDRAIGSVIAAGAVVAALQEKALAGLEENQLEVFAGNCAKARTDFTKAYRELAELARF